MSLLLASACGDDDAPSGELDAGTMDAAMPDGASPDGASPDGGTELALPGLDGEVEVVYDERGIPHIYASTRHDLMVVQGYLMSRDRFAQMELIRRNVQGRLAEVGGYDQLDEDTTARWEGYRRMGQAIYESLAEDDITRLAAEHFVEGVNLYIDAVDAGTEDPVVPGAELLRVVLYGGFHDRWTAADIFAIARFQSANLSFDPRDDLNRSLRLAAVLEAFPADAADPRLAARAGYFEDMYGQRPARAAFTDDGFPDGTTMAIRGVARPFVPDARAIRGALPFLERVEARAERIFGDSLTRGSNNWAVEARHTASGSPILANDPHLALISPSVWWYVHLNTARMGGEDMIDSQGTAFAGLPGVVIGFNRDVAWGVTTTGYDVTDAYQEELTGECDGSGNVVSGTLLFEGEQSPIEFHEETIRMLGGDPVTVRFAYASHRPGSQLLPGSCVPIEGEKGRYHAISVRYTGWEISNELRTFTDLMVATDAASARDALDSFQVGSQNFMIVDREGIMWSSHARIPVRDERAMTYEIGANGVPSGHCPHLLLPGTGEYEWTGDLPDTAIPHELAPESGWLATANQDTVGVTEDGNPCNDPYYIGAGFDFGWREGRIQERLRELVVRGDLTPEDMMALQADERSALGSTLRDVIVDTLGNAGAIDALGLTEAQEASLAMARSRLEAWSLATPSGVGPSGTGVVADSIATTIFNAAITRIIPLAFGDEQEAIGFGGSNAEAARLLEWAVRRPETLHSYDAMLEDTVLWDDLRTADRVETRDEIVIRGVLAGLAWLEGRLGADPEQWRWGRLHTVRFRAVVPQLQEPDVMSIPPSDSEEFPDGFNRHGDFGGVDPGNYGMWNTESFSFSSGTSQRLVVEMLPEGPRAWNALPGGQSIDPRSPHKMDEALLWARNQARRLHFTDDEVQEHAVRTLRVLRRE